MASQFNPDDLLSETGFQKWLERTTPAFNWKWRYIQYIREHLDKVTSGEIKRLMIFLPPRHGKSELATIRYPVYRLECDQKLRIIIGAYNQELASLFSRRARRIAQGHMEISKERSAANDWETLDEGGVRASGVGVGVTGRGANLIVIDDPIKSRKEAESRAYRDHVWDWYTNDLYTRLEPDGAIILIMTRWHEDDLAGRILASEDAENWTVINLPAEADENDPLGRLPGEALCPARYDKKALADRRRVLGRDYESLFQQRPRPREGDMFKRHWFATVNVAPADARRVRYWDKASALDGDYTAGVLMADKDGLYYIEDVVRGRWSTLRREQVIKATTENDDRKYGGTVKVWIEQEGGSSGLDSAKATIKNLAGFPVRAERPTGSKEIRAEPLATQAEAGNVLIVKGSWNGVFLDEITSFPNGVHDDQVDAASGAFNKLSKPQYARIYGAST